MTLKRHFANLLLGIICLLGIGCFRPPYNNFQPDNSPYKEGVKGAIVGTTIGVIGNAPLPGLAIGLGVGQTIAMHKKSKRSLIKALDDCGISYILYGNRHTLI